MKNARSFSGVPALSAGERRSGPSKRDFAGLTLHLGVLDQPAANFLQRDVKRTRTL